MSTVMYPHIAIRSDGHPITADSHYKVRILVEEYLAGATPADLLEYHERLSLSEIHAALSYYYDHKEEMDKEIAELEAFAESYLAEHAVDVRSLILKSLQNMSDADLRSLLDRSDREDADWVLSELHKLGRKLP